MKYPVYKPNKNVNGCAATFAVVQTGKDLKTNFFISMIQQSGWDDKKKTGSFAGSREDASKNINFKLSVAEAGEILSSFKTRVPFVAFHKFNDDTTVIRLTPWDKNRQVKEQGGEKTYVTPAWGFAVTKNSSETFRLPLEAGEAEVLAILLKQFIEDSLFENSQDEKTQQAQNSSASVKPERPQQKEKEEDDSDIPF